MAPDDSNLSTMGTRATCAVVGAQTAIGRHMPGVLDDRFELIGLVPESEPARPAEYEPETLRTYDPFSRAQTAAALEGADVMVYAGHGVNPAARLVQGSRDVFDLVTAQRVGAAAAACGLQAAVQVVELFDLAVAADPENQLHALDAALGDGGLPVTTLYTDFFLGRRTRLGRMLRALLEHRRSIPCPPWARRRAVDVVATSEAAAVASKHLFSSAAPPTLLRLKGSDETTLCELAEAALERAGCSGAIHRSRFDWIFIRAAWLHHYTDLEFRPTRRLFDLLKCGEPPGPNLPKIETTSSEPDDLLVDFPERTGTELAEQKILPAEREVPRGVYSLQRLPLPKGRDARWATTEYLNWLGSSLKPILRVDTSRDGTRRISLRGTNLALLELTPHDKESDETTNVFHISGGLLDAVGPAGRLEFTAVPDRNLLYTSVEDFHPALPWILYRWSQALVHRWIMRWFGRHLARLDSRD